eukprot:SAG22_NODE_7_length_40155_cov_25.241356_2_plen_247_part_00
MLDTVVSNYSEFYTTAAPRPDSGPLGFYQSSTRWRKIATARVEASGSTTSFLGETQGAPRTVRELSSNFWAQHPGVAPRFATQRQPVRRTALLRQTRSSQLPGNLVDGGLSTLKDFHRPDHCAQRAVLLPSESAPHGCDIAAVPSFWPISMHSTPPFPHPRVHRPVGIAMQPRTPSSDRWRRDAAAVQERRQWSAALGEWTSVLSCAHTPRRRICRRPDTRLAFWPVRASDGNGSVFAHANVRHGA